ncbi:hypothetical protein Tco_0300106 [Tanacetum coccineum]
MEVDIEEDENEPELTYPYEEVDPLNPPPPAFESEPDDEIEVENPIVHEDETVPVSVYEVGESSTAAIPQEDGDRLLPGFMRRDIDSLFCRMVNFSRRLCGRETAHALVEKKGKAKDKFYGKLILDLGNEVRSSVEQGTAAMEKLVEKLGNVEEKAECKKLKKQGDDSQAKVRNDASGSGPVRGQDIAPAIRKCNFAVFMKCNPTVFCRIEGAVELRRWLEKTESVFRISECAEGNKVRFAAATLEGPSLTWWNSKIATMGLETVNRMPWTKMKQLMTAEFCPIEEIQRMEHEMVEPKRMKVDAYIRGLTDNIKGEVTSSKPADLNEAVRMAHKLMEQKSDKSRQTLQNNQKQGNARAMVTAPTDGKLPLCERCFTRHVGQCTIKCHKCGKVGHKSRVILGTDVQRRLSKKKLEKFVVELMLLRTLSRRVRMWLLLVKNDAVIVCGEKVVRIPYGNKTLIVEGDKGVSRLKVISCIKARKYIERGCHLFLAHVMEKKSKEKRMEDVPVIHDFPEVFPEELPGLPPPRQVEF